MLNSVLGYNGFKFSSEKIGPLPALSSTIQIDLETWTIFIYFISYLLTVTYHKIKMEPPIGVEPTTYSLRVNCSTN